MRIIPILGLSDRKKKKKKRERLGEGKGNKMGKGN